MSDGPAVAVLGAGSIGTYVGGAWAAAGLDVTLIGRERIASEIAAHGFTLSDFDGWQEHLAADAVAFSTDPSALGQADLILLTVKSGATGIAAREIATHARAGTPVISLQNGIGNVPLLRERLGERHPVIWAMVPFNVVQLGDGRFHKGVAGRLIAGDGPEARILRAAVAESHEPLTLADDMAAVAWGKLVINLNNAVNALSGLPLVEQLRQRDYRRVVAASQAEALGILRRAGIRPAKVGPVPPRLLPLVIGAPDWLFARVVARGWKIDAKARSSMADDLAQGRTTEVDQLNGEVVALGDRLGLGAPVNRRIVALIRQAEGGAPPWEPAALRREILGR